MQTSMVIESLLDYVSENILSEFEILKPYVFDDSLNFRERAVQYLTRKGVFQTLEGETPDTWTMFIWTRSPLTPPPASQRYHSVPFALNPQDTLIGEYEQRTAQIDITCKMVCNNIEQAETMEEHMFVKGGDRISFEVDYGAPLGKMRCSAEALASTNFEVEDLDGNGTVVAVSMDLSIYYPVFAKKVEYQPILEIKNRTMVSDESGDEMVVS